MICYSGSNDLPAARVTRTRKDKLLKATAEAVDLSASAPPALCPQTSVKRDQRLDTTVTTLAEENSSLKGENSRLKAEVARLRAESTSALQSPVSARDSRLKRDHDEISSSSSRSPTPDTGLHSHKRRKSIAHTTGTLETAIASPFTLVPESHVTPPTMPEPALPDYMSIPRYAFHTPLCSRVEPVCHNNHRADPCASVSFYRDPDRNSMDKLLLPPMRMNCVICADEPLKCICGDATVIDTSRPPDSPIDHYSMDTRSSLDSFSDVLPPLSLLENLPPYQPPVPLRRRPAGTGRRVFTYTTPGQPAMCTGDPSSCPACANDPFGKAFCEALGGVPCGKSGCTKCPSKAPPPPPSPPITLPPILNRRCAHGFNCDCGSAGCALTALIPGHPPVDTPQASKTVPTNCAWSQLKSHPNVGFTDLRLLAEVVAGKPKVTGPRVLLSPPPHLPESRYGEGSGSDRADDDCARQSYREVQASNLRQALAILDQQGQDI